MLSLNCRESTRLSLSLSSLIYEEEVWSGSQLPADLSMGQLTLVYSKIGVIPLPRAVKPYLVSDTHFTTSEVRRQTSVIDD